MALPPKKLLIPRKGIKTPNLPVSTSDHDTNMRAIEEYINNLAPGGVIQLIAGTNITLSPTDGQGVVTINATSGGGGGSLGFIDVTAGMDQDLYPFVSDIGIFLANAQAGVGGVASQSVLC